MFVLSRTLPKPGGGKAAFMPLLRSLLEHVEVAVTINMALPKELGRSRSATDTVKAQAVTGSHSFCRRVREANTGHKAVLAGQCAGQLCQRAGGGSHRLPQVARLVMQDPDSFCIQQHERSCFKLGEPARAAEGSLDGIAYALRLNGIGDGDQ